MANDPTPAHPRHEPCRGTFASAALRVLAPLVMLALTPLAIPGLIAGSADPAARRAETIGERLGAQTPSQAPQQAAPLAAQSPQAAAPAPAAASGSGCSLTGLVSAGQARLPGVVVTAAIKGQAGTPLVTSTGIDGVYALTLPGPGRYEVRAELSAFATVTKEVSAESPCKARLDLPMTLASRVPAPAASTAPGQPVPSAAQPAPRPAAGPAAGQRGATGQFQRVNANGTGQAANQADSLSTSADDARALAEHLSLPPGFSTETLSDTVTAFGRSGTGQTNDMLLFGPGGEGFGREGMMMPGMPGMPDSTSEDGTAGAGAAGGFGGNFAGGGFGGEGGRGGMGGGRGGEMGGGPGGRGAMGGPGGMGGPPGGGGPGGMRGGLGERLSLANRMRTDRPHGNASYQFGGSPLDAAPYSLNGRATTKPSYYQNRISASVGGQAKIPHLFDLGSKTSYFFSYSGNHSSTLANAYSTVPTAAERAGDFSSSSAQLIDPATSTPFAGNVIPTGRINPAALALLQFIPLPNQPGVTKQNYYYSTTNTTSSDQVSFRFVRTFGNQAQRGGRGMMGGPGGPGGRGGGPGGRGANLNISVNYQRQESTQNGAFPSISGTSTQSGLGVPVSFSFTKWGVTQQLRANYNRNDNATTNAYANLLDVAGSAGVTGVATDPFDWGIPSLSFSGFSGLRDIAPSVRNSQSITLSDSMSRMYRRHALRWGIEYRDERLDSRSDASARGAYVFTGLFTGGGTAKLTGADLADFLLGLPQQASIQYGPGLERFRSHSFNAFFQDDWRVSSNFTINMGVRYEYQSPYSEAGNRLENLDVNPAFTQAVAVQAGALGVFTGLYPNTVIEPDRNNVSPRIGIAWRPIQKTVIRAGYGINYSSVPYLAIAQKLASQPPFAKTDTRIGSTASPLALTSAFTGGSTTATTNNFGVDRTYSIGYVHLWNFDIQRELTRTLSAGLSYIGTKGANLDLLRAPNRSADGTTITGVAPFIWESDGGRSLMNSVSVRLRKRLTQGLSLSGTYTYGKSMDNASSLTGGGGGVVAQNDKDLEAEWSLSSFDVRHRFTGDFSLELPFGAGRRWLTREGFLNEVFGGWMMNGTVSFSSGTPFTPRVTGAVSDVANGVNGTLRANYDGSPIAISDPTVGKFFNTSAFSVPASGTFGTAGRNVIIGPGSTSFNMGLMKNFTIRGTRGLSVRAQANNVLNVPVWGSIDTTVNSPTFGQVVSVRSMRSVQLVLRLNY